MKKLFLLLLGCSPFLAAAFGEKADRIGPYYVYYESDSTLGPEAGKVRLECHFYGGNSGGIYTGSALMYGIDGSNEQTILDEAYKAYLSVLPGEHRFQFAFGRQYEEIETIPLLVKPGELTVIVLNFFRTEQEIHLRKPVIYCYPETETAMTINVFGEGTMTFTYPELPDGGWKFTAQPDGTLRFYEKTYPYLFWEMTTPENVSLSPEESFRVKGENVVAFLEKQLTHLGLTEREQADFITFWGPLMAVHAHLDVQFVVNEACDAYAQLKIFPNPDHVNRVYMLWRPVADDAPVGNRVPRLPVLDRSGFDVLEWGGMEL